MWISPLVKGSAVGSGVGEGVGESVGEGDGDSVGRIVGTEESAGAVVVSTAAPDSGVSEGCTIAVSCGTFAFTVGAIMPSVTTPAEAKYSITLLITEGFFSFFFGGFTPRLNSSGSGANSFAPSSENSLVIPLISSRFILDFNIML